MRQEHFSVEAATGVLKAMEDTPVTLQFRPLTDGLHETRVVVTLLDVPAAARLDAVPGLAPRDTASCEAASIAVEGECVPFEVRL